MFTKKRLCVQGRVYKMMTFLRLCDIDNVVFNRHSSNTFVGSMR